MQIIKPVGRQAASRKYDILTALTAYGLSADRGTQTRVLRLISLITARYNWQRDELCVGQREIARMWSVDERTVKREMARLRALGWLVRKTRGTRGRIGVYGIDLVQILEDTRPSWGFVGEDFVARLQPDGPEVPEANNASKVVPLRRVAEAIPDVKGQGVWTQMRALLASEQPALYSAWLSGLTQLEAGEGCIVLMAGSSFQQSYISTHCRQILTAVARRVDPSLNRVDIIC